MPQSQALIRGWRIWVVLLGFLLGAGYIGVHLFKLQVLDQPAIAARAANNITWANTILPNRGLIHDSRGFLLAGDALASNLYLDKSHMSTSDLHTISDLLGPVLGQSPDDLYQNVQEITYTNVLLAPRLDDATAARVRQLGEDWPLVQNATNIEQVPRRDYPDGNFASHLLGFADYDNRGQYGVEEFYNYKLAGVAGSLVGERDTKGYTLPMEPPLLKPAVDGADIVLTLDSAVQYMAERELDNTLKSTGAQKGMILIMDPHTGAIIALATSPRFDPNSFTKVNDLSIFKDPAITDVYEPGSTFKVLTMASAIDGGAVTPDTTFYCTGTISVYGWQIHNSTSTAYGVESMRQGLARSDNMALDFAATSLGEKKFYQYIQNFGIGKPTGVDLAGEVSGLFTTPSDADYSPINLYTNAFGQGVAVTPIQLVTAISAVANGGNLMKPYVVSSISRGGQVLQENKPTVVRRVISESTSKQVRDMMVWAVDTTTAGHLAKVPGYKTATKTGTAQIPGEHGYDAPGTIASVVGFAPADNPKFVMLIRLDRPVTSIWGGETASPAFGRLAAQLFEYWKIPPDEPK